MRKFCHQAFLFLIALSILGRFGLGMGADRRGAQLYMEHSAAGQMEMGPSRARQTRQAESSSSGTSPTRWWGMKLRIPTIAAILTYKPDCSRFNMYRSYGADREGRCARSHSRLAGLGSRGESPVRLCSEAWRECYSTSPIAISSDTDSSTKGVFVYGAGLDWGALPAPRIPNFQYRGNLYKAPNLTKLYTSTDRFTHTAQPMIGAYFRF